MLFLSIDTSYLHSQGEGIGGTNSQQLFLPLISQSSMSNTQLPADEPSVSAAAGDVNIPTANWLLEGTFADSSGNGFNGTGSNNVATTAAAPAIAGNPGTCTYADFNGSNQYATVPYSAQLNADNFTVSFWARVDGGAGSYRSPITSRWQDSSFNNRQRRNHEACCSHRKAQLASMASSSEVSL